MGQMHISGSVVDVFRRPRKKGSAGKGKPVQGGLSNSPPLTGTALFKRKASGPPRLEAVCGNYTIVILGHHPAIPAGALRGYEIIGNEEGSEVRFIAKILPKRKGG